MQQDTSLNDWLYGFASCIAGDDPMTLTHNTHKHSLTTHTHKHTNTHNEVVYSAQGFHASEPAGFEPASSQPGFRGVVAITYR